jgi:hypothetical protein
MKEQSTNEELSINELLETGRRWYAYLKSKRNILIISGLVGASVGLAISYIKKPVYTATLSFALEDDGGKAGLGGALGLASQFGLDVGNGGGGIFSGANLIELFKSRSMVEQTLLSPIVTNGKEISLAEMYIQNNGWRKNWEEDPGLNEIQFLPKTKRKYFTREHDSILGKIYEKLSKDEYFIEQPDIKTGIIVINVSSTDELFAKAYSESIVKVVSDFYIEAKSKKSRLNMDILKRQSDSIRAELNNAITGVAVANDNTFNLNPALNVRRTPSARKQVDVQANGAILTELVKQTELAKITLRKDTPLIQIIDSPVFPLKKEEIGKFKGFLIGFILTEFLLIIYLILKKKFKELLN